MYILWDGNWENPEIEISDSAQGLIRLGELLVNISEDFTVYAEQEKPEFYPEKLESASIRLIKSENAEQLDLIHFLMSGNNLLIEGSKLAFSALGMSLINYFNENSQKNAHFHLDYVERDPLLAPTNYSIIFLCRGQVI